MGVIGKKFLLLLAIIFSRWSNKHSLCGVVGFEVAGIAEGLYTLHGG